MELALLALLLAFAGSRTQSQQQAPPVATGGAAPPDTGGSSPVGGAVAPVVGVVAPVSAIVSKLGILGSGAVVGTTTATAGATTVGASTTIATTTGSTTGVTTGAGLTLAGIGSNGAPILLTTALAGPGIIVGIVLLFIIAKEIVKGQEADKDFQGRLFDLNPNARALNGFESNVVERIAALCGATYTAEEVRDPRFDRLSPGSKTRSIGYRKVYRLAPVARKSIQNYSIGTDTETWRVVRAMALRFLSWRIFYGYRIVRNQNWLPKSATVDWGMSWTALYSMYNDALYKEGENITYGPLGGVLNVPHAAYGETVEPRADRNEALPPALELIAGGQATNPNYEPILPEVENGLRYLGLLSALSVWGDDPRPPIAEDEGARAAFAQEVLRSLGWPGEPFVDGQILYGTGIVLNPSVFGRPKPGCAHLVVPWEIKNRAGQGVYEVEWA